MRWALIPTTMLITAGMSLAAPGNQRPFSRSSVDRDLHNWIPHCGMMQIQGSGLLWKKDTGLSDHVAIHVRDKAIMYELLRNSLITDKRFAWNTSHDPWKGGEIEVEFLPNPNDVNGERIEYICHGNYAYDVDYSVDSVDHVQLMPLRVGYGRRFEAFVRHLAKRARNHDPAVHIAAIIQGD